MKKEKNAARYTKGGKDLLNLTETGSCEKESVLEYLM